MPEVKMDRKTFKEKWQPIRQDHMRDSAERDADLDALLESERSKMRELLKALETIMGYPRGTSGRIIIEVAWEKEYLDLIEAIRKGGAL